MEKENQVQSKNQVPVEESPVEMGKRIIEEKERKDAAKAAADATEERSLTERLMKAVFIDTVEVTCIDDKGAFIVRCRRFTWSEHELFLKFIGEVEGQKIDLSDSKVKVEAYKTFFGLLAYPTGVCLDPELDFAFWSSGKYSLTLPTKILNAVRNQTEASVAAASSFRQPAKRSISS